MCNRDTYTIEIQAKVFANLSKRYIHVDLRSSRKYRLWGSLKLRYEERGKEESICRKKSNLT